jgi:hypothetical protein
MLCEYLTFSLIYIFLPDSQASIYRSKNQPSCPAQFLLGISQDLPPNLVMDHNRDKKCSLMIVSPPLSNLTKYMVFVDAIIDIKFCLQNQISKLITYEIKLHCNQYYIMLENKKNYQCYILTLLCCLLNFLCWSLKVSCSLSKLKMVNELHILL